ncbi:MAG: acyl-ACP--UDP-N-acetylglucosamine O-acyltransferase [Sutterellaceae bacterium]|nr:acyl-ACP--UDP-N-acetylglucosamine O-acyltransferase [Sutterellaceae bacterium]
MAKIHPSSIVDSKARLADDVEIGPFCIVGPDVTIGAGTKLRSHVTVSGRTTIGERNVFYQGAAVGCDPQDKKYAGEPTRLEIGDDNVVRENCTLSIGTVQDIGLTTIGSRNLLMANVHIAHDCRIGNDIILANNNAIAGHVHIEDHAILGGQTGVHQFVHVGTYAMVGGASGVLRDVPPYVICSNNPCEPHGLNLVGLRRAGFSSEFMTLMKAAYKSLYREGNLVADFAREMQEIIAQATEDATRERLTHFRDFVTSSPRGIIR